MTGNSLISIYDLRLPRPFLKSNEWPVPRPSNDRSWLLPLDLAAATGGPFRTYLQSILNSKALVIWNVPLSSFASDSRLLGEAKRWLEEAPKPLRLRIERDNAQAAAEMFSLHAPFESVEILVEDIAAGDWLDEVAPEFMALCRESGVDLSSLLAEYERALGQRLVFPWRDFGYLAGFLRQKKHDVLAAILHLEWSRAQTLFSPQDEMYEARSLRANEIMLNPTTQVIRKSAEVLIMARAKDRVSEMTIDPRMAAIIDEIGEGARLDRDELAKAASEILGLSYHKNSEIDLAIDDLLRCGILLRGSLGVP